VIVSLIVAMDENGGIAYHGQIPWHLPAELRLFKQTTTDHHLLMGRKTYETIKKPLPGRITIVITSQRDYHPEGCLIAHSLQEGLALALARGEVETFICGGGEIYAQALTITDRIYLTVVHTVVVSDIKFPVIKPEEWYETQVIHHPADEKNPYAFTRRTLDKRLASKVDKP